MEHEPSTVSKGAASHDDVPSAAASMVGLCATDPGIRSQLPVGSRIQHRASKDATVKAPGFQAWPPSGPSQWFSYGPKGHYSTKEDALQQALAFVKG